MLRKQFLVKMSCINKNHLRRTLIHLKFRHFLENSIEVTLGENLIRTSKKCPKAWTLLWQMLETFVITAAAPLKIVCIVCSQFALMQRKHVINLYKRNTAAYLWLNQSPNVFYVHDKDSALDIQSPNNEGRYAHYFSCKRSKLKKSFRKTLSFSAPTQGNIIATITSLVKSFRNP